MILIHKIEIGERGIGDDYKTSYRYEYFIKKPQQIMLGIRTDCYDFHYYINGNLRYSHNALTKCLISYNSSFKYILFNGKHFYDHKN